MVEFEFTIILRLIQSNLLQKHLNIELDFTNEKGEDTTPWLAHSQILADI